MRRSLYLMRSGVLRRKENTLYLELENGSHKYFPIEQVQEIHAFGEVELNKRLLEHLGRQGIPLHFYNRQGYYVGSFYPREHYNSGYMLLKQAEHYLDPAKRLDLARRFVRGGLENLLQVLRYYARRDGEKGEALTPVMEGILRQQERLGGLGSIEGLMQAEGQAREAYYQAFDLLLGDEDFAFGKRTRRPPKNRLNALLSFGNGLLYAVVLSEIYKTHLDPRIGFLHAANSRRFSLNLDVAEVFKPLLVDRLILSLLQRRQIQAKHFEEDLEGLYLTGEGRRVFLQAWEERLQTTLHHRGLNRKVSYRRLIRLELYKLEKHLIGEEAYEPFRTRW